MDLGYVEVIAKAIDLEKISQELSNLEGMSFQKQAGFVVNYSGCANSSRDGKPLAKISPRFSKGNINFNLPKKVINTRYDNIDGGTIFETRDYAYLIKHFRT